MNFFPRLFNAIISKFVKAQEEKTNVEIWGTGVAIREWLYARDFGRIVFQIIQNATMLNLNEPVNVAQNFEDFTATLISGLQESSVSIIKALSVFFGGIASAIFIFTIAFYISLEDRGPEKVLSLFHIAAFAASQSVFVVS